MKFCKTYQNHMKDQARQLPEIGFRRYKKTLKKCRNHTDHNKSKHDPVSIPSCLPECSVCDGAFFPSLLDEMSAVVHYFNIHAQKLLHPPFLSDILEKYCIRKNKTTFIEDVQDLIIYAMVSAVAFRKILKKYDKVHNCAKGQAFKSAAQVKHMEILHSPWLCELMAYLMNMKERKMKPGTDAAFNKLALEFKDDKPSITCELPNSIKIDVELSCSICLDTVFDAVALRCGHNLCYMCACSAASVTIVDGLKAAAPQEKCPLCREARVYNGAIHLKETNTLLSRRCPDYWSMRLESERRERIRLVKEHWQSQCRAFLSD